MIGYRPYWSHACDAYIFHVEGIGNVLPKQTTDFGNRTFQSETSKKRNGLNDVAASARTAQETFTVLWCLGRRARQCAPVT